MSRVGIKVVEGFVTFSVFHQIWPEGNDLINFKKNVMNDSAKLLLFHWQSLIINFRWMMSCKQTKIRLSILLCLLTTETYTIWCWSHFVELSIAMQQYNPLYNNILYPVKNIRLSVNSGEYKETAPQMVKTICKNSTQNIL